MEIPIYNSIYKNQLDNYFKSDELNLNKINKLNLSKPLINKFNTLKVLKLIPEKDSLYETIVISVNDELVNMFLNKKIEFNKISFYLLKIINFKKFRKYCRVVPKSVEQIYKIKNLAINSVHDYLNLEK